MNKTKEKSIEEIHKEVDQSTLEKIALQKKTDGHKIDDDILDRLIAKYANKGNIVIVCQDLSKED